MKLALNLNIFFEKKGLKILNMQDEVQRVTNGTNELLFSRKFIP